MNKSQVITLDKAEKNVSYKLCGYETNCLLDKRKLYNVGIIKGTEITPLYGSMIKGATAYLIKGSVIALRDKDAKNMFVRKAM